MAVNSIMINLNFGGSAHATFNNSCVLKCLCKGSKLYHLTKWYFDEKICSFIFDTIMFSFLSHDVASGSDITLCNKICKPLVVYRFTGNVMTSITTLRT